MRNAKFSMGLIFICAVALSACHAVSAPNPIFVKADLSEREASERVISGLDEISPSGISSLLEVAEPQISPDGSQVIYRVGVPNGYEGDRTDIWSVSTLGGASIRLTDTEADEHSISWVGERDQIAFLMPHVGLEVSDPDISGDQIFFLNLGSGHTTQVTHFKGGVSMYSISPDGRSIALMASDATSANDPGPRGESETVEDSDLWLLDIATGATRRLSEAPIFATILEWSPNGSYLAVRHAKSLALDDVFYRSSLTVFEVETQSIIAEVPETIAYSRISWAPNNDEVAFGKLFEGGVHYEPRIFSLSKRSISEVADDRLGLMNAVAWSYGSERLFGALFSKTQFKFVEINQADGALEQLFEIGGGDAEFSIAKDKFGVAYLHAPETHPSDVYFFDGEQTRRLTSHNVHAENWALGDVREIEWHSSIDGRPVYGVLVTPPGYDGNSRLKLITQIHGGPEWYWTTGWSASSWHDWSRLLASEGYAVFLPNPRGSDGQGEEFTRAVMGDWMGADYQDILDGIDHLIEIGVADADYLGIGGWSYGGYASAWALSQEERFKAVVIGAPMTNLRGMMGGTDTPYYLTGYMGPIAQNGKLYDERSPVYQLGESVSEAVLLLHTEHDVRVPLLQSRELYRRLIEINANVEYYVYQDEGHWILKQSNEKDLLERVTAFFQENL